VKATTSGRRVWALKWERDEGAAVVFIASSRKGAFEWVRRKFQPQLGPPRERNVLLIIPAYVDHDLFVGVGSNPARTTSSAIA